jgi:NADPH:quinone reductase-like Zn-dependent oxidoreductase
LKQAQGKTRRTKVWRVFLWLTDFSHESGGSVKAAVHERFGGPDVLEVRDISQPVPGPGEVLVRVHAAAINPKDALVRGGKFRRMSGSDFPKLTGLDYAGSIAALGPGVSGFAVGEAVFGMLNGWNGGTCAEYVLAKVGEFAAKPARLDFAEAAAIPLAALTALQALRDLGRIGPGSRVCIHGASGGVGLFAVQLAKALGGHVTALCGAAAAGLVRSLGADEVLDYKTQPPAALTQRFDCFFDVFGNQSFAGMRRCLAPRGMYISTVPSRRNLIDHLRTRFWPGRRARLVVVKSKRADLETLARWTGEGKLRGVIAARFPLTEIRRAHEQIQTKRTHGKIIIDIAEQTA